MPTRVVASVAQVQSADGTQRVTGAGFLVAERTLVTCTHVVEWACPRTPLGQCVVRLRFLFADGGERIAVGRVVGGLSRADLDIAFLEVEGDLAGTAPVALGLAGGAVQKRTIRAYGFPGGSREDGRWADGHVVALADPPTAGPDGDSAARNASARRLARQQLLQLESNDLTTGFSGGPVLDLAADRVIGMVAAIESADRHSRGQSVAWAIPARALLELNAGLQTASSSPYRGLSPFTAADSAQFQGRADAVEAVLRPLLAARRIVLLLGPSGSGKSSLMQAGVLPALAECTASGPWHAVLIPRPGRDLPRAAEAAGLPGAAADGLAAAVRRYSAEHSAGRILIVVDQFEELLAERVTADEVHPAITAARQIMTIHDSAEDAAMVLVVRDDFYSQLAEATPDLLRIGAPGAVNVPVRLDRAALSAIIQPPGAHGMPFDVGLVERIIADMTALDSEAGLGTATAAAKMLPALELTLARLWEQAEVTGSGMTHHAYGQMGGVAGGFVSWGDQALRGLTGAQREAARRILSALVRPADEQRGIPATRVRRRRGELRTLGSAPGEPPEATADAALDLLVRRRVLVAARAPHGAGGDAGDDAFIELVHDSLIQQWGMLSDWVAQAQQFTAWLDRVDEKQRNWAVSGEKDSDLLAGTDLAEGLRWKVERVLPGELLEFLARSQRWQERQAAERLAAERRRTRTARIIAALLAVALVAGGIAFWQQTVASAAQARASARQLANESAQLAAASSSAIGTDAEEASRLAVEAYRKSPTSEALSSLEAAADLPLKRVLGDSDGPVGVTAFSPDGRYLATGDAAGQVVLWDTQDYRRLPLKTSGVAAANGTVDSIAFSQAGELAAGFGNGDVALWASPYTGEPTVVPPVPGHVAGCEPGGQAWGLAFASDGHLVIAYNDCVVGVLAAPYDGTPQPRYLGPGSGPGTGAGCQAGKYTAVAISADGEVAVGYDLGDLRQVSTFIYKLSDLIAPGTGCRAPATILLGHDAAVTSVAFSPDGSLVASASGERGAGNGNLADRTVLIQNANGTGTTEPLDSDNAPVDTVVFSPSGQQVVTAEDWGRVRIWSVPTGNSTVVINGSRATYAVAWSANNLLASGGPGGAFLWSLPTVAPVKGSPPAGEQPGGTTVAAAALSPDGHQIADAVTTTSAVQLWKIGDSRPASVQLPGCSFGASTINDVAYSPDGRLLVAAAEDNPADSGLIDVLDLRTGVEQYLCISGTMLYGAAISPDDKLLAFGTTAGVRVDAIGGNGSLTALRTFRTGTTWSVAFSPDGTALAAGGQDGTVRVWSIGGPQGESLSGSRVLATFGAVVRTLAFSPDGGELAAGSWDSTVQVWNARTWQLIRHFTVSMSPVDSVGFNSDGHLLVTGSDDGYARVWNVETGNMLANPQASAGANGHVEAVAFGTGGTLLLAGGDNTLQLLHLTVPDSDAETPQQLIAHIENALR